MRQKGTDTAAPASCAATGSSPRADAATAATSTTAAAAARTPASAAAGATAATGGSVRPHVAGRRDEAAGIGRAV